MSRTPWLGLGVEMVSEVGLTDSSGDGVTAGMKVEVEIAGLVTVGRGVGTALQLASPREYTINTENALNAIVVTCLNTIVRPSLAPTKTQVYFLRDHRHRLPSLPILP